MAEAFHSMIIKWKYGDGGALVTKSQRAIPCALQSYEDIHGYLAVTICVLGTIFNIVNILVLSHKVTTLLLQI